MQETKNESSKRKVVMDWQVAMQFSQMIKDLDPEKPIFVNGRIYNSMVNNRLRALCIKADIPIISIHGLRHTHASLLLFAGCNRQVELNTLPQIRFNSSSQLRLNTFFFK